MKNNLKLSGSFFILSALVVLFVFSASAWGYGTHTGGGGGYWDPQCPSCYEYLGGVCINTCLASNCKACVNGHCVSTCNSNLCQICVNGHCQSACDPVTEECVNGQCVLRPIVYAYDAVGNRTSMTDPSGVTSYTYDYLNRLISVTNPDNKTIHYQYDAGGNRTQLTDPAGGVTVYSYDDDNRLIEVTKGASSTTYQYDSLGNLILAILPNGTYTEYAYNSQRNWLTTLVNKNSTDATLTSFSYTYDNAGNRLSVAEHDGSAVVYAYDDIYQLTSETRTGTNPYSITYQYDDVGNRTQMIKNAVTTNYVYNENNQLLTETAGGTTATYAYDLNGNLQTKTAGGNTTGYTWDWANRLISVSSVNSVAYSYDGDGTRISKTQNAVKTKYINDVALPLVQVLTETDATGNILATYNYGRDLISMNKAGTNSYYHYDGLGSTRQLTDSNEAVVANYTYDSFGSLIASSGTTENTYKFTGEEFDDSSGLLYLRARYYDSEVGRFISRDPILTPMQIDDNFLWFVPFLRSYPQIFNSYNYVCNNPVNFIDPFGIGELWENFKKRAKNFMNWVKNWLGYATPSPIGEAVGVCEAAPDVLKIMKARENLNDMAKEDLEGDRLYSWPRSH